MTDEGDLGGQQPEARETGAEQAADGLDPQVGGLLAYLLFGWIGGLIMYFTQRHPEVRFHGAQSVLYSIALFVIYLGLGIVSSVLTFGVGSFAVVSLFSLLYSLVGLAAFGLWILLCIKGYQLEHFKLPVLGDIAERWAVK